MHEEQESDASQPIASMVGEKMALGPLRRELIPTYQRWMNDPVVQANAQPVPAPWTVERTTRWVDGILNAERSYAFTIYTLPDYQPIGTTRLGGVDFRNRSAEFDIAIGESDNRGQGYGTEATRLLLDYAFRILGLRNVMLAVAANNRAGIRAYQRAGFKEIGRRRQCWLVDEEFWDLIFMDCLASEFTGPAQATTVVPPPPEGTKG